MIANPGFGLLALLSIIGALFGGSDADTARRNANSYATWRWPH